MSIRIEVGKYYKNREGDVVGPMKYIDDGLYQFYPFEDDDGAGYRANGRYDYATFEHMADLVEEVEGPNIQHKDEHGATQAADPRDAEIEKLKINLNRVVSACYDYIEHNRTLRTKVEELEREVDMYNGITLGEVVKERDELRSRITELKEHYNDVIIDLREKLADECEISANFQTMWEEEKSRNLCEGTTPDVCPNCKPKQPTIISSTWQNIYAQLVRQIPEAPQLMVGEIATSKIQVEMSAHLGRIGVLRRDTYSDKTVKTELEPIK